MAHGFLLAASIMGCEMDEAKSRRAMNYSHETAFITPLDNQASEEAPTTIQKSTWIVEQLGEEPAPDVSPPAVVVTFWANGRLGGMQSCNAVGGAATWHPEGTFANLDAPLIATLMGCGDQPEEVARFANRFWKKMKSARNWRISGGSMEIEFADGTRAKLRKP